MPNKLSYEELEEVYTKQKEAMKLLCSLAKDLLTVVERQNIKLDNLSSAIPRFKIQLNAK